MDNNSNENIHKRRTITINKGCNNPEDGAPKTTQDPDSIKISKNVECIQNSQTPHRDTSTDTNMANSTTTTMTSRISTVMHRLLRHLIALFVRDHGCPSATQALTSLFSSLSSFSSFLTPQVRQRLCMGLTLTVLSVVGYQKYYHRQYYPLQPVAADARRRQQRLLPPHKRLARQAPLSSLFQALAAGTLRKALVGSKVVYYYLNHNNNNDNNTEDGGDGGTWKQSALPANNPHIHTHLLERLTTMPITTTTSNSLLSLPSVSLLPETDEDGENTLVEQWSTVLWITLPFVYLALLSRMLSNLQQRNSSNSVGSDMSDKTSASIMTTTETTTFAHVGGLDSILTELRQVVDYCQHPHRYRALRARPPRGILLHGPPGTGKTLLARALAGEASLLSTTTSKDNYRSSGGSNKSNIFDASHTIDSFTVCSASEFVEVYVGRGAARIRSLFQSARTAARQNYQRKLQQFQKQNESHNWWQWWSQWLLVGTSSSPPSLSPNPLALRKPTALIFIDELDAVAKKRSGGRNGSLLGGIGSNDEREQTLDQLLTEMDGFSTTDNNSNNDVIVIVVAASNRADVLDPAVLRRLDLQLYVGLPDLQGRVEILQIHAQQHGIIATKDDDDDNHNNTHLDWIRLAQACHGMTGSDLRAVVNDATLLAVRSSCSSSSSQHQNFNGKDGQESNLPATAIVTMEHMEQAIERLQRSKRGVQHH